MAKQCRFRICTVYVFFLFDGAKIRVFLYFSMNYREFLMKSKLIISLFQTVKLSTRAWLFKTNDVVS